MRAIGIDIVSIERIKKTYDRFGDKFLNKILTNEEIKILQRINSKQKK